MNEYAYVVISLIIFAVFVWSAYIIEQQLADRHARSVHQSIHHGTYIFGRAYYSHATMEWREHGIGHARKMTGKELVQYEEYDR